MTAIASIGVVRHSAGLACGLLLHPTAELRNLHLILDNAEMTYIGFEILQ